MFYSPQHPWKVQAILRRFFTARVDIEDGESLWPSPQQLSGEEQLYRQENRLRQVSEAYGISAGQRVAWAFAVRLDHITAVRVKLCRGCPYEEASKELPVSLLHMQYLPWGIIRAATMFDKSKLRRRVKSTDGGRSALDALLLRAVVEGSSARSVSEVTARAADSDIGGAVLAHVLARSLSGGFLSCGRRPGVDVRTRLAAMQDVEYAAVAVYIPKDIPLVSAALMEYADALHSSGAVEGIVEFCGGADRWSVRAERARTLMDIARGGLDTHWTPSKTLESALASSPLTEVLRRVHRRSHCVPPLRQQEPPPMPVGCSARVCIIGSTRVPEAPPSTASSARDIVVCEGCGALKNFIMRSNDGKAALSAAGYRNTAAPNPLDETPRPMCMEKPSCSTAVLRSTPFDEPGCVALVRDVAVVKSPCCGLLCAVNTLISCSDGTWKCLNCVA